MAMQEDLNGGSESRLPTIEAGLKAMREIELERDMLVRKLNDAMLRIASLQAELGALQVVMSRQQTEVDDYRRARDTAVEQHAAFKAIFAAVLQIMQNHAATAKVEGKTNDD